MIFFKYPIHELLISIKNEHAGIPTSSNFIPFKTIFSYLKGEPQFYIALKNVIGNIFIFFPFGFLLPLMITKINSYMKIIVLSFGFSLLLESTQFMLKIGSFDIDDLILNTLGAVIGYVLLVKIVILKSGLKKYGI
ncbi:VanZ family protein [Patescibacteria group bacterium]|nr:VanZ family protein [Patescibacteria group bacterium]